MHPQRLSQLIAAALLSLLVFAPSTQADQAAVEAAIQELGGRINVGTDKASTPDVSVDFEGTEVTDDDLRDLHVIKHLTYLDLIDTEVPPRIRWRADRGNRGFHGSRTTC